MCKNIKFQNHSYSPNYPSYIKSQKLCLVPNFALLLSRSRLHDNHYHGTDNKQ